MKLKDFLESVKGFPADALVSVAEVDEAFAMNVASVELVSEGRAQPDVADGEEAIELANGEEAVVVIRW